MQCFNKKNFNLKNKILKNSRYCSGYDIELNSNNFFNALSGKNSIKTALGSRFGSLPY